MGVYAGMRACAKERWGSDSLEGKHVTVQGVGAVGYHLVKHVYRAGARVTVCDLDDELVKRVSKDFKVSVVKPDKIFSVQADIFAPSALGGIINDDTIPQLKVEIVAGSANNVLENERKHSRALLERDILYAPDYVINSGGLINVANELEGYNQQRALRQAEGIYNILLSVFDIAKREDIPTQKAADNLALRRIAEIGRVRSIWTPHSGRRQEKDHIRGVS